MTPSAAPGDGRSRSRARGGALRWSGSWPPRAALPRACLRRGQVPDQVLEAAGHVRRGRARRDRANGRPATLLLGFSMGGAVAIKAARHPSVEEVVGLAPWIPDRSRPLAAEADASSSCSMAASTATCPASRASARATRARGFERARRSASRGATPSFRARCTASPSRAPWGTAVHAPARPRVGALRRVERWKPGRRAEAAAARAAASTGTLTFETRRSCSIPRITHHERSIWNRCRPCRAEARESVMVVVPALAEHERRDEPVVPRLVA